jgi:hypothetical protein
MTPQEALQMIARGEGQCVEFKSTFAEADDAIESLCAFANSSGGTVLLGVADDGRIVGASIGKKTIADFCNKLKANTQPLLTPSVDQLQVEGRFVVAVAVDKPATGQLFYAFNRPYVRVGTTNQVMPVEQQRVRLFEGFRADAVSDATSGGGPAKRDESWDEREQRRVEIYTRNRGLFLVHTWRPSSDPDQVADILIFLRQHDEGPLNEGRVKSVEYHLGPMFHDRTIVKTDPTAGFRLEVSAYAPMLCLARVNFDDVAVPLDLERYIDF